MFPTQSQPTGQNQPDLSKITIEQQIRALQIIRAALIAGVLTFAAIVLTILAGMPEKLEFGVLEIVLVVVAAQSLVVYLFAPKFVRIPPPQQDEIRQMKTDAKDKALMLRVTTVEIIRGAAIEGVTFFALILILIADSKVGLIVAAFMIAAAFALFPTASRIRSRIETLRFELGL